jgi:hypothetical protein
MENTASILLCYLVAVDTFLFAEPLLSNGCFVVASFAAADENLPFLIFLYLSVIS